MTHAPEVIATRPVEAGDVDLLRRLFHRLSPRTVYLRFFQPVVEPQESTLRYLADVDHQRRHAIAAVVDGEFVGVARYDRLREDPSRAEVAVVVEDAWQGVGVGSMLLEALAEHARTHGVDSFTASVLGENAAALRVVRRLAPHMRARIDGGEWAVDVPLSAA